MNGILTNKMVKINFVFYPCGLNDQLFVSLNFANLAEQSEAKT